MKSTATPLTSGPELVPTLVDQLLFSGEIANDRIVVRVNHAHLSKARSQCDVARIERGENAQCNRAFGRRVIWQRAKLVVQHADLRIDVAAVITSATSATALHDFAKRRRMVCLR
jgi:hypothetical protein